MPAKISDEAFGRAARQMGAVTLEQLEKAKTAQVQEAAQRPGVTLADVLVRQGLLTQALRENVEKIVLAQQAGGIQQLGQYKLLKKIGEGGMGTVYLADDLTVGRRVAVKVLPKKYGEDREFLSRFRREALMTGKLNHVNIVSAYTCGEELGLHYYAMEFCDGSPLDEILDRQRTVPWAAATSIVLQVARGLKHAHAHNILHRDIKPANVFICRPLYGAGKVPDLFAEGFAAKILDLGLSKVIGEKEQTFVTQTGMALGTPHYISPEQARGEKDIDGRTDIYSLGATFYHIVTGHTPFQGSTAAVIMTKHLTEDLPNPHDIDPDLPDGVVQVIMRMMAKEPIDRYRNCDELLADLELVISGKAPSSNALEVGKSSVAMRVRPLNRRRAAPRKNSANWMLAGAALLIFAVLATALFYSQGTPKPDSKVALGDSHPVIEHLSVPTAPSTSPVAPATKLATTPAVSVATARIERPEAVPPDVPINPFVAPPQQATPRVVVQDDEWVKSLQAKDGAEQLKAVMAKLVELNPKYDGFETHQFDNDGHTVVELKISSAELAGIAPLRALKSLRRLDCTGVVTDNKSISNRVSNLTPLMGLPLQVLHMRDCQISDLSPLTGMQLTDLDVSHNPLIDLLPLVGMPLKKLALNTCKVPTLERLRGMKLEHLGCCGTDVSDLSPLQGMPLKKLSLHHSLKITDLVPLKGVPVEELSLGKTSVTDLSPLLELPLKTLDTELKPDQMAVLKTHKTLTEINHKPVADFWAMLSIPPAPVVQDDEWTKAVQLLSGEEQVKVVLAKLVELNQKYDGTTVSPPKFDAKGAVTELLIVSAELEDIAPLRALKSLETLQCSGHRKDSKSIPNRISNLWPLKGLRLKSLRVPHAQVSDLAPLAGMPLTELDIRDNPVSNLLPLSGLPLTTLNIIGTKIHDLDALRGMKLTTLMCDYTDVGELEPLHDMPLKTLYISHSPRISDLSPLSGRPLGGLSVTGTGVQDLTPLSELPLLWINVDLDPNRLALLKSFKSLNAINNLPLAAYWGPKTTLPATGIKPDFEHLDLDKLPPGYSLAGGDRKLISTVSQPPHGTMLKITRTKTGAPPQFVIDIDPLPLLGRTLKVRAAVHCPDGYVSIPTKPWAGPRIIIRASGHTDFGDRTPPDNRDWHIHNLAPYVVPYDAVSLRLIVEVTDVEAEAYFGDLSIMIDPTQPVLGPGVLLVEDFEHFDLNQLPSSVKPTSLPEQSLVDAPGHGKVLRMNHIAGAVEMAFPLETAKVAGRTVEFSADACCPRGFKPDLKTPANNPKILIRYNHPVTGKEVFDEPLKPTDTIWRTLKKSVHIPDEATSVYVALRVQVAQADIYFDNLKVTVEGALLKKADKVEKVAESKSKTSPNPNDPPLKRSNIGDWVEYEVTILQNGRPQKIIERDTVLSKTDSEAVLEIKQHTVAPTPRQETTYKKQSRTVAFAQNEFSPPTGDNVKQTAVSTEPMVVGNKMLQTTGTTYGFLSNGEKGKKVPTIIKINTSPVVPVFGQVYYQFIDTDGRNGVERKLIGFDFGPTKAEK